MGRQRCLGGGCGTLGLRQGASLPPPPLQVHPPPHLPACMVAQACVSPPLVLHTPEPPPYSAPEAAVRLCTVVPASPPASPLPCPPAPPTGRRTLPPGCAPPPVEPAAAAPKPGWPALEGHSCAITGYRTVRTQRAHSTRFPYILSCMFLTRRSTCIHHQATRVKCTQIQTHTYNTGANASLPKNNT